MIRACIFDIGGTIVDKYSLTPLLSLKSAFELKKINVFQDLLQKDMGLKKMDHIGEILKDKRIIHKWEYKHGKKPDENDKYEIYDNFLYLLMVKVHLQFMILTARKNHYTHARGKFRIHPA